MRKYLLLALLGTLISCGGGGGGGIDSHSQTSLSSDETTQYQQDESSVQQEPEGSEEQESKVVRGKVVASLVQGVEVCSSLECSETNTEGEFEVAVEALPSELTVKIPNSDFVIGKVQVNSKEVTITPESLCEKDENCAQNVGAFFHLAGKSEGEIVYMSDFIPPATPVNLEEELKLDRLVEIPLPQHKLLLADFGSPTIERETSYEVFKYSRGGVEKVREVPKEDVEAIPKKALTALIGSGATSVANYVYHHAIPGQYFYCDNYSGPSSDGKLWFLSQSGNSYLFRADNCLIELGEESLLLSGVVEVYLEEKYSDNYPKRIIVKVKDYHIKHIQNEQAIDFALTGVAEAEIPEAEPVLTDEGKSFFAGKNFKFHYEGIVAVNEREHEVSLSEEYVSGPLALRGLRMEWVKGTIDGIPLFSTTDSSHQLQY